MGRIPLPEAGLVISYAYLWHQEHQSGQQEGNKNRPVVILLATESMDNNALFVTVLPITHSLPTNPEMAIEIPMPVKRHLGLDEQRSWVIISEGNEFIWPGYDLAEIAETGRFDYGFLPPRFFKQAVTAFLHLHPTGKSLTPRD